MLYNIQGVFIYWITNNLFSVTQTKLLKTPAIADMCKITLPVHLQKEAPIMAQYASLAPTAASQTGFLDGIKKVVYL